MLDLLKKNLEEIRESCEFREWKTKHNKAFFCSAFLDKNWKIDFYDPDTDKITTFFLDNRVLLDEGEVFKSGKDIKELDLDKVKVDLKKALAIITKILDEKYREQSETRKIIILQNIERPIWNITYIMSSLNILNVKIDARTGEILNEEFGQLLKFKK